MFALFVLIAVVCSSCASTASPTVEVAKTLIPTREATLQLTPYPVTYLATTRAGQELQFRRILLEANEYVAFHTEGVPQGIPLASGVELSFDYISQVDFGIPASDWDSLPEAVSLPEPLVNPDGEVVLPDLISDSGNWLVTITLTDGSKISTSMGFKAHHKIHLTGDSNYGFLDISLTDIQKIVIQRTADPKPIPSQPSGDNLITVETSGGDVVSIAYPKLFTTCMYDVYCCHGEDLTSLPLEGSDILLDDIRSVEFSDEVVSITLKDGKILDDKLRSSAECPGIGWRLRGKAALGDFELPLSLIKRIEH
ncbi:MAG: hypothetical protein HY865_17060 [Chloroflexi bacterium]|nr:hypothetical protein [Chloroflexota bacterium]